MLTSHFAENPWVYYLDMCSSAFTCSQKRAHFPGVILSWLGVFNGANNLMEAELFENTILHDKLAAVFGIPHGAIAFLYEPVEEFR